MTTECYLFPSASPCFILGGRNGDILQMLPCFYEVFRRTCRKPTVITSSEFASLYDGVSYVTPRFLQENWWKMIPMAQEIAKREFGQGTVIQFWQGEPTGGDEVGKDGSRWTTLQCHGQNYGCNMSLDPNYGTSMARRCGFSKDEWVKLPLVIDRRDPGREQQLTTRVLANEKRPILLYNFSARTFQFPHTPEVLNPLMREYGRHFRLVDLGKVMAARLYDLLGVYDRAVGLITADTATAHLAVGSKIPTIWFQVPGWCGSVPRGNCVFSCTYPEIPAKMEEVLAVVKQWKG